DQAAASRADRSVILLILSILSNYLCPSGCGAQFGQRFKAQQRLCAALVLDLKRLVSAVGAALRGDAARAGDGVGQVSRVNERIAAQHDLDSGRVFAGIFHADAAQWQMRLFTLRAQFAEDFQPRRARMIAFAELPEVGGQFLSSDFALHNHSPFDMDYSCWCSRASPVPDGRATSTGQGASRSTRSAFEPNSARMVKPAP